MVGKKLAKLVANVPITSDVQNARVYKITSFETSNLSNDTLRRRDYLYPF